MVSVNASSLMLFSLSLLLLSSVVVLEVLGLLREASPVWVAPPHLSETPASGETVQKSPLYLRLYLERTKGETRGVRVQYMSGRLRAENRNRTQPTQLVDYKSSF